MEQGLVDISKQPNRFWQSQRMACLFTVLLKLAGLTGKDQAKETADYKKRIELRYLALKEAGE